MGPLITRIFTKGFNNRAATVTRSFFLLSNVGYGVNSRAALAKRSFVPLRFTQDDRRHREDRGKKKGSGGAAPFFPLPTRASLVILNEVKDLVAKPVQQYQGITSPTSFITTKTESNQIFFQARPANL
jgi:hypothetical protein